MSDGSNVMQALGTGLLLGMVFGVYGEDAFNNLMHGGTAISMNMTNEELAQYTSPADLYQEFTKRAEDVFGSYGENFRVTVDTPNGDVSSFIYEPGYRQEAIEPSVRMIEPTVAPAPAGPQG